MARDWSQTGASAVNSTTDFFSGMAGAFKGIGKRIKKGKMKNFAKTFCAIVGDVASQNGRLLPEEVQGFRNFLLQNCRETLLEVYSIDEMVKMMQDYAVAAFLGQTEAILLAIQGVEPGSDDAANIVMGALAMAFADGDCDDNELKCIEGHSRTMGVSPQAVAQSVGLQLPDPGRAQITSTTVQPQPQVVVETPTQVITPQPQATTKPVGKSCPRCKGVAGNSCAFCKGKGYYMG